MMNLKSPLEALKNRNKNRQEVKNAYDKILNFSVETDENTFTARVDFEGEKANLLSEGTVLYADGSIRAYIAKGTLEKFMQGKNEYVPNIDESYVGLINIGHKDYVTNPESTVGTWKKEDMSLSEKEDGRSVISVNKFTINQSHRDIIQLKESKLPVGLSAEFYRHINEEESKNATDILNKLGINEEVYVIDEVCIKGYAVVGECGDVNASDLLLSVDEPVEEQKDDNVKEDLTDKAEEQKEEPVEEPKEETVEEPEKTDEMSISETVDNITKEIERLKQENEMLSSENAKIKEELKARREETKDILSKLSINMPDIDTIEAKEEAEVTKYDKFGTL